VGPEVGHRQSPLGGQAQQLGVGRDGLALLEPARHGRDERSGRQPGEQFPEVAEQLRQVRVPQVVGADDGGDERGPQRQGLHRR
jgi:hypothetical protein